MEVLIAALVALTTNHLKAQEVYPFLNPKLLKPKALLLGDMVVGRDSLLMPDKILIRCLKEGVLVVQEFEEDLLLLDSASLVITTNSI